jgi:hypothetical protein
MRFSTLGRCQTFSTATLDVDSACAARAMDCRNRFGTGKPVAHEKVVLKVWHWLASAEHELPSEIR